MGIFNIDLNNINLDKNFDEDDPDTIILLRIFPWHIEFEKSQAFKKDEERIIANSVASQKMVKFLHVRR